MFKSKLKSYSKYLTFANMLKRFSKIKKKKHTENLHYSALESTRTMDLNFQPERKAGKYVQVCCSPGRHRGEYFDDYWPRLEVKRDK